MVTRSEVLRRAATLWPTGTVPYSQDDFDGPTGYRQDCSGFVSMCWGIPRDAPGSWGGMSTVSLVTDGWMREIHWSDLRPGDAVGICGPGTGGDEGHIVLFEKWDSVTSIPGGRTYWAYEQAGGRRGPVHRVIGYPYGLSGGDWRAWRFRDIQDDAGGDMAELANEIIEAWSVGNTKTPSGHQVAPTVWRQRDEVWQKATGETIAALRAEVAALRAELAARPVGGVSPEQVSEIARQTAALIGGSVADTIHARMKE